MRNLLELEANITQRYTGFLSRIVGDMRRDFAQIRTVSYDEICAAGLSPMVDDGQRRRIACALSAATRQDFGPAIDFAAFDPRRPELFHIVVSGVECGSEKRGH